MAKQRSTTLALALALGTLLAGCAVDEAAAPDADAALMAGARLVAPAEANGIRLVYLEGDPYQMGYQHGALLADEIAEMVEAAYLDFVWSTFMVMVGKLGPDDGRTYMDHAMENALPTVVDECRGIVDGSRLALSLDQCIMLSAITYFVEDLVPRHLPGIDSVLGCSSFVASGGATVDGRMIHGRNLDYLSMGPMRQYTTLFVRQPTEGSRHLSFSWPGQASVLTGMNEHGLAIGVHENSCPSEDHRDMEGVPALHQALAVMSQAATIDEAVAIVEAMAQGTCQMMILSHGPSNQAAVLEMNAAGVAVRRLDESATADVIFATNHFVVPELGDSQQPRDLEDLADPSVSRFTRLSERLTGASLDPHEDLNEDAPDYDYGAIDVAAAIDILRDPVDMRADQERQLFPCTESAGQWALGNNHNIHSAIMFGDALELWLAAGYDEECGNAVYNPYVGFDLAAVLAGEDHSAVLSSVDPPYNDSLGGPVSGDDDDGD